MWFKNLCIYPLSKAWSHSEEQLEQALNSLRLHPLAGSERMRLGFVPPVAELEQLSFTRGGQILIVLQKDEKILPANVIKQHSDERIAHLEAKEGRALRKKERESIKDDVINELLPRAFQKSQRWKCWIDSQRHRVIVEASSRSRAEEVLSQLRKALGSLPVIPLAAARPAELMLTHWLRHNELPKPFEFGEEIELREALDDGGIVRAKRVDVLSEEIQNHLAADKLVKQIQLLWEPNIAFVVNDELQLKAVKALDGIAEQYEEQEDAVAQMDADWVLMTGTMAELIDQVEQAFEVPERRL